MQLSSGAVLQDKCCFDFVFGGGGGELQVQQGKEFLSRKASANNHSMLLVLNANPMGFFFFHERR